MDKRKDKKVKMKTKCDYTFIYHIIIVFATYLMHKHHINLTALVHHGIRLSIRCGGCRGVKADLGHKSANQAVIVSCPPLVAVKAMQRRRVEKRCYHKYGLLTRSSPQW